MPNDKRCLILELWGLGDAVMMTAALQGILRDGWTVTVASKAQTRALLESSYPEVNWIEFDPPWTVFKGKYRLWRWPWQKLIDFLVRIRRGKFDAILSGRVDPRDHLLMLLAGSPRRIGFSTAWSRLFLTERLNKKAEAHRVEDWWTLEKQLTGAPSSLSPPKLTPDPNLVSSYRQLFAAQPRPFWRCIAAPGSR